MAVQEFHLRSAVLCAPFTSTTDMAKVRMGIPNNFPFQHSFDNRPGLRELEKNHGRAWIIHGDKDTVVPVAMSRTLAKEFPDTVKLHVIPGGNHGHHLRRAGRPSCSSQWAVRVTCRVAG